MPDSIWLGDIMGDFDIRFVGTRNALSKQMKMQAYDRLISMMQVMPQQFQKVDLTKVLIDMFGDVLDLTEVAADLAQPSSQMDAMQQNALLQMLQQATGGGQPGAPPQAPQPAGMGLPQAAGAVAEEDL
jgi:hypothetical protein